MIDGLPNDVRNISVLGRHRRDHRRFACGGRYRLADVTNSMGVRKPRACSQCGGRNVLTISYGLPSPETFASAERGEIALGGCVIEINAPRWECGNCKARFAAEPSSPEI